MSKFFWVGTVAALVCVAWAANSMADYPYGGARAFNRSLPSQSGSNAYRSFSYSPSYQSSASEPSYRSFSYEPVGINAGDTVVVSGGDADMKRGTDAVGTLPNETEFVVTKVKGGWLGAVVEVDGQTLNGWVRHENVRLAGSDDAVETGPAEDQEFRRFSYEPSPQPTRSYRNNNRGSSSLRLWQLPKTDPRRMK